VEAGDVILYDKRIKGRRWRLQSRQSCWRRRDWSASSILSAV